MLISRIGELKPPAQSERKKEVREMLEEKMEMRRLGARLNLVPQTAKEAALDYSQNILDQHPSAEQPAELRARL